MQFIDACAVQDVRPGKGHPLRLGGRDIALFNIEGDYHAIENSCLHQGSSLSSGTLCGPFVVCPAHGWRFDVTSGQLKGSTALRVACYPVRITDGRIHVAVDHQVHQSANTQA